MNTNQKETLQPLIVLRTAARRQWKNTAVVNSNVLTLTKARDFARKVGNRVLEAEMQCHLDEALEAQLTARFQRLQIGTALLQNAPSMARDLPREVWLEPLCVNRRHWSSEDMREYGTDPASVVGILNLENSETENTAENRPLHGCFQLALYNRLKTDPRLGKFAHEAIDEMLDGKLSERFGEWQEPTTLHRLGVV